MRKTDITDKLSQIAFDFFFSYSRFEFALKVNGYLKSHRTGDNAEPGWIEFVERWQSKYLVTGDATLLLASPPERQVVGADSVLAWEPVKLDGCKSDLAKIVRLVKTVRNNLFHGGKHGSAYWDDPARTENLLNSSRAVLDEFADLASIEADYTRYY